MRISAIGFLFLIMFTGFMPRAAQAEEIVMEPITQEKIEQMMFGDTPEGCVRRFSLFAIGLDGYKNAEAVDELADMKIIQPFIQKVYDTVREKGVPNAMVGSMQDFQSCAEKYQSTEDGDDEKASDTASAARDESEDDEFLKSHEQRRSELFESCGAMNAITLAALDGVQRKKEESLVIEEAKAIHMITKGTILEKSEEPEKIVVSKVYDAAKSDSYDRAVEVGFGMVMHCFGTKR